MKKKIFNEFNQKKKIIDSKKIKIYFIRMFKFNIFILKFTVLLITIYLYIYYYKIMEKYINLYYN